jgi:hypothetical protein
MIQVFSKEWFQLHQPKLIWLANNWLTKRWFRWVLRIRKFDCPIKTKINYIGPNFFTYNAKRKGKKIEATTDFRVNDKFARRLYYAFKPLWYLLHGWDLLTVRKLNWNLGFDTLTQYPGSTAANNPCDGQVGREAVNETFSTIRAGAGNANATSSIQVRLSASATNNQYQMLRRALTCFDTSALPDTANISEAVLSLYGTAKGNTLGETPLHVCAVAPAATNAIANADYGNFSTTSFGSISYTNFDGGNKYNGITLNSDGKSAISLTGITKYGQRLGWDILNDTTGLSWNASTNFTVFAYNSAAAAGTSTDPKLVVTYTVPSGSQINALLLGIG